MNPHCFNWKFFRARALRTGPPWKFGSCPHGPELPTLGWDCRLETFEDSTHDTDGRYRRLSQNGFIFGCWIYDDSLQKIQIDHSNHQKSYWTAEPGTRHSDALGQFDVVFFLPFLPRCFATTMQHLPSKSQNTHALPCVSILYIHIISFVHVFIYLFTYSLFMNNTCI